jgi:hypothetical protein
MLSAMLVEVHCKNKTESQNLEGFRYSLKHETPKLFERETKDWTFGLVLQINFYSWQRKS